MIEEKIRRENLSKEKIKNLLMKFSVFTYEILQNLNDTQIKNFNRDRMEEIIEKFVEISMKRND